MGWKRELATLTKLRNTFGETKSVTIACGLDQSQQPVSPT